MRPPSIPHLIPIHEHDSRHTKIMKQLYNALVEYREPKTNRIVIQSFISLPSRKEFPEYFDIIEKPLSMYEIRKRIESNTYYRHEDSCLNDIRLMFNNCRVFNEDFSQIFKDAVKLEDILLGKYEQLLGIDLRPATNTPNQANATSNNTTNTITPTPTPTFNQTTTTTPTPATTTTITPSNGKPKISAIVAGDDVSMPTEISEDSIIINHDFHNETSIDSSSNLSIPSSDKPKRLRRDPDAPKRRLLTGYIIYAAEVRKEYVDKHPNQDFGYISRLIGNDWKALPRDLRVKYDQRALAHNKKIRERALRDSMLGTPDTKLPSVDEQQQSQQQDGNQRSPKPRLGKISKRKLAKELNGRLSSTGAAASHKSSDRHLYTSSSSVTVESSTQTAPYRFVEPPQKRTYTYSENFRRYIETLEVPNRDLLYEETAHPDRVQPAQGAIGMLGAGIGRHRNQADALWALRDFLLQDVETMRWNMQPYTYYSDS